RYGGWGRRPALAATRPGGADPEAGLTPDHTAASAPIVISERAADALIAIDLAIPASPSSSPGLLFEAGQGRGIAVAIGDGSTGLISHAAGDLVVGQALNATVGVALVVSLAPLAGQTGTFLVHVDPGNICRAAWRSGGVTTFLGSAPSTLGVWVDTGSGNWGAASGAATQAAASVAAAAFVTGGRLYEVQPLPAGFPTS
ncbi:MAG: hypothetical protein AAF447_27495, partial [Myxococcota bacterium]